MVFLCIACLNQHIYVIKCQMKISFQFTFKILIQLRRWKDMNSIFILHLRSIFQMLLYKGNMILITVKIGILM